MFERVKNNIFRKVKEVSKLKDIKILHIVKERHTTINLRFYAIKKDLL